MFSINLVILAKLSYNLPGVYTFLRKIKLVLKKQKELKYKTSKLVLHVV